MALVNPLPISVGESKKIMVYSHDTFGLGNIRRMLAICQYLRQTIPNVSILLLSGSPMLQSFRLPVGLDYIKLPCLNRGTSGKMAVKYLNTDIKTTLKLRSDLILVAAKNYQPDLVLVDKKPSGIQGELSLTIDYLKHNLPTTKFVLLLRDILDTPAKTIQEWEREFYYHQVESIYDRLLVVGMQEIFNLCDKYKFSQAIAKKVRYCGYISKHPGQKTPSAIYQELEIQNPNKLVLVTPGGGQDGYNLISNYLQGLAHHQARLKTEKIHSLIFCGAEMSPSQQLQIKQVAAKYDNVSVLEFTNDMMSYINVADIVVSMGGYNTITEVLQLNKLSIVVPRTEPGREQLIRAQNMAKARLIEMIHPEELNPELLFETLLDRLTLPSPLDPLVNLDFDGLLRVSDHLIMLLYKSFYCNQDDCIVLESA